MDPMKGKEIYDLKFPDELYGAVIDGIDVTILSSDTLRLIQAYAKQGGELSEIQRQVLRQCEEELRIVIPQVEGRGKKYFQRLEEEMQALINRKKSC
ncbi:MAG: hypothetical protein NUV91_05130 [Candidatus Omnitrophica bacterium]|nr:hypothetical protein [Candidatus Omnitrophota bacterium]